MAATKHRRTWSQAGLGSVHTATGTARRLMAVMLSSLVLVSLPGSPLWARGSSQSAAEFVNEVFAGQPPSASQIWLTGSRQDTVSAILGHRYPRPRLHFWRTAQRSVWVLDEIGKEQPITVGVVIQGGAISELRVLAYRESRGGEVRQSFFTDQFDGQTLTSGTQLSAPIDGITGATLSVRALTRISRLGLWLDNEVSRRDKASQNNTGVRSSGDQRHSTATTAGADAS